ncbi:S1 family peptidase [Streptomyces sp. NPDC014006]|uniref:S1 family peptidase n=1 Tax=Streptomyces sp. NPDC014006 TaxID=3364870 RepID=UPI0036FCF687
MHKPRRRAAVVSLVSAAAVAAGVLATAPAHAVVGDSPKDGSYAFTAKLDIGNGARSCTGTLVEQQWLVTAASCFAENPAAGTPVAAGAPRWKTTATIGRTDLNATGGAVTEVVELVPRTDRDLVMARLAAPVPGVAPARIATTAPQTGEALVAAGYGRTKDEWVPDRLHTGAFTAQTVKDGSLGLEPAAASEAALCKGDTGGPTLRESPAGPELAAVNSRSWQGGCLGTPATETRRGATSVRVDDIAGWIEQTALRSLLPRSDWKKADLLASGYFTGGSAGASRHMDLLVRWSDGSVSLFQGADRNDPQAPFAAQYQIAKPGSVWQYARAIAGGGFADGGEGLVVRWSDGEVSQYTTVDRSGFHGEKMLTAKNATWQNAKLVTLGRFNGGSLRDDLLVVWASGTVSIYPDLGANALRKETQIVKNVKTWTYAEQIGTGDFTGAKSSDLMVRWIDGETTIYPAVDLKGLHGEKTIRPANSPWSNATVLTTGAFTENKAANDVLVRWSDGRLTLHPGVDGTGLHSEVRLAG